MLNQVRVLHSKYLESYRVCMENRDFTPLKDQKTAIQRLIKELQDYLKPEKRFHNYLDNARLSKSDNLNEIWINKLKTMVSAVEYRKAADTAEELDSDIKLPERDTIINKLMQIGADQLAKLCRVMSQPEIIIVPPKNMLEVCQAIELNPHCSERIKCKIGYDSDTARLDQLEVFVIDMLQYTDRVPGQYPSEQSDIEQYKACEYYYSQNGLQMVTDRQYAVAMQKSLRSAQYYGGRVIDSTKGRENYSFLRIDDNKRQETIKAAYYQDRFNEIRFDESDSGMKCGIHRGRACLRIL